MTDRIRLGLRFDAAAMRRDLARLAASDWVDHFVPSNYRGTWTVLPLRAPAGATHPIAMIYSDPGCDTFIDTPLLASCPAFQRALAAFECPLQAVRLMKLTPGSEIKPHRDFDLDVEHGRARLHIVVATNPDVEFLLNGARVRLDEGECWYLRLSDPHAVANRGATDRIHLVIDAVVNPWLETALAQGDDGAATAAADRRSDLERFRELVLRDASLQRPFLQHDEREAFMAQVIETAAAAGFHVTAGEIDTSVAGCAPAAADGAGASAAPAALAGWVPYRVRAGDAPPRVDWCHLGAERFTAPFFAQTIDACLRKPFNQLFAHETAIDALLEAQRLRPGLAPTAFIYHCSRCGSTLYAQLAAALPQAIAISEAPPIDQVLCAAAPDAERIRWLRALVSALAQPRRADDRHVFVKFDAWHIAQLDLVQQAFPGVPCLFLYRDPAEVLASHLCMPGMYMVPGVLDPSITGIEVGTLLALPRDGQYARILEWILAAGLAHAEAGRVTLANYTELPGAAVRHLLAWCDLSDRDDLRGALEMAARFDAKTPSLPFSSGARRMGTAPIGAATGRLTELYERLEARRRAQV